jgi:hypothetical protein
VLGGVLLSMGAFLFFNQVMVSSEPMGLGRGMRYGQGFGRLGGEVMGRGSAVAAGEPVLGCPRGLATTSACC